MSPGKGVDRSLGLMVLKCGGECGRRCISEVSEDQKKQPARINPVPLL